MDVRALTGTRPDGQPDRIVSYGTVSVEQPAPAATTDPLYVVIPSHSAELSIRFDSWPQLHGGTFPEQGADVVVAWDERDGGVPHVVWWDGEWSRPPNVITTTTTLGGDVTGTPGATVVDTVLGGKTPAVVAAPVWQSLAGQLQTVSGATWADYGGAWTIQCSKDADGWVSVRGLVKTTAGGYSYAAASALVLFMPSGFVAPTRFHMFNCDGADSAGNYYKATAEVYPQTGAPNGWAGGLQLVGGVGSNNGQCQLLNLGGIRYNVES